MTGKTVSHYRVISRIGGGGMGVVYRGEDARLERAVALKFLHVSAKADAIDRFQREARAASALNHPHICTVYDIGEYEGAPFLVMELLEGVTLEQLLREKRLTLDEMLEYAVQIADALEAAHALGIVHRDIKPANIFITHRKQVKVLDFGLAKLSGKTDPVDDDSATAVHNLTIEGVTVGTISYMSPEQAVGEDVDQRADLFSFGVVLYEMATGILPFRGSTAAAIYGAILHEDPEPASNVNPTLSPELQILIEKALEKDRELRCQTAAEMKADLKRMMRNQLQPRPGSSSSHHALAPRPAPRVWLTRRALIAWSSAAAGAVAIGAFGLYRWAMARRSTGPVRLQRLTTTGTMQLSALSPDGRFFAGVFEEGGQQGLILRLVSTASRSILIAPSDVTYDSLTYSRDGDFLYFCRSAKGEPSSLYRIPVLGATAPQKIISFVYHGVSFSPDGKNIAFLRFVPKTGQSLLMIAAADGSDAKQLAARQLPDVFGWPAWSPDDSTIACTVGTYSSGMRGSVVSIPRSGGPETALTQKRWNDVLQIEWMPDGRGLVLVGDEDPSLTTRQLWYLSYPDGAVHTVTNDLNSYAGVSVSRSGASLVTVQTLKTAGLQVVDGTTRDITPRAGRSDGEGGVIWAGDSEIVYCSRQAGAEDIYRIGASGGTPRMLTSGAKSSNAPRVCASTGDIVFVSNRANGLHIWRMGRAGDSLEQLTNGSGESAPDISPDGKWLFYVEVTERKAGVYRIALPGGKPERIDERNCVAPVVSPDGKLVAYLVQLAQQDWRVAVMPVQGGKPADVYGSGLPNRRPLRWKGNGLVTYFETTRGVSNITGQSLGDAPPRPLTNFTGVERIFSFDWSPAGKLVCSRGIVDGDAVLVTGL